MVITQKLHDTFGSNILMFEIDKPFYLSNRDSMVGPLKMEMENLHSPNLHMHELYLSYIHTNVFAVIDIIACSFTKATNSLVVLAVMLASWLLLTWEQLFELNETIWSSKVLPSSLFSFFSGNLCEGHRSEIH